MTTPLIQIDDEIRPMNNDELAQYQAIQAENAAQLAAEKKAESDKMALLERLGITADEAALLLK
jgi:hypothetical protein